MEVNSGCLLTPGPVPGPLALVVGGLYVLTTGRMRRFAPLTHQPG